MPNLILICANSNCKSKHFFLMGGEEGGREGLWLGMMEEVTHGCTFPIPPHFSDISYHIHFTNWAGRIFGQWVDGTIAAKLVLTRKNGADIHFNQTYWAFQRITFRAIKFSKLAIYNCSHHSLFSLFLLQLLSASPFFFNPLRSRWVLLVLTFRAWYIGIEAVV